MNIKWVIYMDLHRFIDFGLGLVWFFIHWSEAIPRAAESFYIDLESHAFQAYPIKYLSKV